MLFMKSQFDIRKEEQPHIFFFIFVQLENYPVLIKQNLIY